MPEEQENFAIPARNTPLCGPKHTISAYFALFWGKIRLIWVTFSRITGTYRKLLCNLQGYIGVTAGSTKNSLVTLL